MGTPRPYFHRENGDPVVKMGTPLQSLLFSSTERFDRLLLVTESLIETGSLILGQVAL